MSVVLYSGLAKDEVGAVNLLEVKSAKICCKSKLKACLRCSGTEKEQNCAKQVIIPNFDAGKHSGGVASTGFFEVGEKRARSLRWG